MCDLSTIKVHVRLRGAGGAGARVTLELDRWEQDNGFVVPGKFEGTTDANGELLVAVWPNERGARSSRYKVEIVSPEGWVLVTGYAAFLRSGDVTDCGCFAA